MSREIKFRAWHKNEQRMFRVLQLEWHMDHPDKWYQLHLYPVRVVHGDDTIRNNYILMQFTGFHDKHGKDIYDGDLVKFDSDENVYPVHWGHFSDCCVEGETWVLGDIWQPTVFAHLEELEVIGTLYENPDLFIDQQEAPHV